MRPDDPRHGTTAGHAAGCRDTCCREARNADERRRRKHRQVLGIVRRIDGTGTRRRIQALWAIGWTSREIADACGWGTMQAVTELTKKRRMVYATTAETIARVYEQMSGTPGPSAKNRRMAVSKGWAPPLAWDDIDNDPEPYRPPAHIGPGRPVTSIAALEDFTWLVQQGESETVAAERVGLSLHTIRDYRARLARREAS